MNAIYLISVILGLSLQNVMKKGYTKKNSGGVYLFGVLTCLSATLFFAVTSSGFQWNVKILPFSLAFAAAYVTAMIAGVLAIGCGSLSLTSLIVSYSLLIPALYGLIFLDDPIGLGFYPGILLLVISLLLINKHEEKKKINFKWIIYVILAFLGNGMCSVFQKMQQVAFEGAYKNELMILALVTGAVVLTIISFIKDGKQMSTYIKNGWLFGLLSGMFNGIVNLFVMVLSGRMSASLMFPLISAGGIIVTYLISRWIYKEELTKKQLVGFILGIASVIFLNI